MKPAHHHKGHAGLSCTGCGKCRKVCPFLERYGTPGEILAERPEAVFLCTNCRACDGVCPRRSSPSDALFRKKVELLRQGRVSPEVRQAARIALTYATWGSRFPVRHYDRTCTAFWPGCGLAGSGPDIVLAARTFLRGRLNAAVGIALDCCFDPSYEVGDVDAAERSAGRIDRLLKRNGIKEVITGCANCTKIFTLFLPEVKVSHIVEHLTQEALERVRVAIPKNVFLHHPCPTFRFDGIRKNASLFIGAASGAGKTNPRPSCCGLGGDLASLSTELSDSFGARVIEASANRPVVTYCMECRNKFEGQGKNASHILEYLPGVLHRRRRIKPFFKWMNRLYLSAILKFKIK